MAICGRSGRPADGPAPARRIRPLGRAGRRGGGLQQAGLAELGDRPRAGALARSESTAELLCAELSAEGLPMDRAVAEGIIARTVAPRPRTDKELADQRAQRDAEVLRHAPGGIASSTCAARARCELCWPAPG